MNTRRIIAAFITFTFATLLCAPAFAGVWALATEATASGCCCSKKEETRHVTVQAQACECPACACTIDDAPAPFPINAVDAPLSTPMAAIAATQADAPPTVVGAIDSEPTVSAARGPPPGSQPPLYILYDSFLN